jgi:two-component system chemotaxis response regulator CheB
VKETNNKRYKAIVIGGSAGSFPVITKLLGALPKNFPLPVFLCLHRLKHVRHGFVEALNIKSGLYVTEPEDKEHIKPGRAYLAPANYHMLIELGNSIALSTEEMVKYSRPSIDITFDTASYVYREKLIVIIFSGANTDGADGFAKAKKRGALTIVQDTEEATIKTMPEGALKSSTPDMVLKTDDIIKFLLTLAKN